MAISASRRIFEDFSDSLSTSCSLQIIFIYLAIGIADLASDKFALVGGNFAFSSLT